MAGRGDDTTLGGASKEFPRTTAGFLDRVVHGADSHEGFEELCRRYWRPVYFFIRTSWAKTNDDAKDLTQAFFASLLEKDVVARYQQEKAAFRSFLKMLVRRFVTDEHRGAVRLKRGGGTKLLRFEDADLQLEETLEDPQGADPDRAFDQAWQDALVKYAVDAVRRRLVSQGREIHFRIFDEHDLKGGARPPASADLAARFGLTDREVRNVLGAVRHAVKEEIRAELARQTRGPDEFEEEWNALLRT